MRRLPRNTKIALGDMNAGATKRLAVRLHSSKNLRAKAVKVAAELNATGGADVNYAFLVGKR